MVERPEPVVKKVEPNTQTEKNVTLEKTETEPKQLQTAVKGTTATNSDKTKDKKAMKENNSDEEEKEEDPFMSEDGLPIMEIYEELDDDGNIISSHARPQRSQQLVDFANGPLAEILKKEEKIVTDKKKNAEEASKPKPYGPEKPDWMVQKKPNPYDPPSLQPKTIKKLVKSNSTAGTDATTVADVQSNEKTATASITKQDSNKVKVVSAKVEPVVEPKVLESKPTLEKSAVETSEHEENMTVEPLKSEDDQFEKITPVPKEELVELQIIAGDEDSESDFEAGEDWEYNEEDYDDEESEDEFGRTRGSLFPFSIPHTIQKSIEEKRNKSTASLALEISIKHDDDKEHAIIKKEMEESEVEKSTVSSCSKRQVRFAETVNVKTFEKDPREVHGNIHGNMQNLFEIAREQMEQNGGQPSFLSEEDFIKAHSVEDEEEEEEENKDDGKDQQDYQNRPIVEENLIEREFAPPVDSRGMGYVPAKYLQGDENESDEEDFTVSRAEIAKEYQKIRQSLIYQTGGYGKSIEELELEPVDEDGNAKKVSRFKAARLSTRRTPKF
ncbi:hypothetical protein D0Z00_001185 [Geotrichum galactomycetum]|uniref:Uncharacterized protein n=1 Tax=Geotrichum galactomycetum TaxID=27317 RepID=A0ACB6V7P5_9ASCO|nr:hypothetical protein D0Z00_001185 [Geotrichum candidum]